MKIFESTQKLLDNPDLATIIHKIIRLNGKLDTWKNIRHHIMLDRTYDRIKSECIKNIETLTHQKELLKQKQKELEEA